MGIRAGGVDAEERRGGKAPWWVWLLAGCGGLMMLGVLALVVLGVIGYTWVQTVEQRMGPVTVETAQASLGDVPWYPGAELDEEMTRSMNFGNRMMEGILGEQATEYITRATVLTTPDPPDAVLDYYRRTHASGEWGSGWRPLEPEPEEEEVEELPDGGTLGFENDREVLWIQVMPDAESGGASIWVTRVPWEGDAESP